MELAFPVENMLPSKMGSPEEAKELCQLTICLVEGRRKPGSQWLVQRTVILTEEISRLMAAALGSWAQCC